MKKTQRDCRVTPSSVSVPCPTPSPRRSGGQQQALLLAHHEITNGGAAEEKNSVPTSYTLRWWEGWRVQLGSYMDFACLRHKKKLLPTHPSRGPPCCLGRHTSMRIPFLHFSAPPPTPKTAQAGPAHPGRLSPLSSHLGNAVAVFESLTGGICLPCHPQLLPPTRHRLHTVCAVHGRGGGGTEAGVGKEEGGGAGVGIPP